MLDKYMLEIIACPKCKGTLAEKNDKLTCSGCGKSYSIEDGIPILLTDETLKDYGELMPAWNEQYRRAPEPDYANIDKEPDIQSAYLHASTFFEKYPGDNFLEAGCGTGRMLYLMARKGIKVIGLDLSVDALKLTKRWLAKAGVKDAYLICADMRYLPLKDNTAGFIYGGGSIEHFEETQFAVNELRRILKPGAVMSMTYPVLSLASITYRQIYGNIPEIPVLKHIYKFIHVHIFRKHFMIFGLEKSFFISTMEKYYRKAGFTDVKSGYFDSYLDIALFKGEFMKNLLRKMAKNPLFWPMVYTNGVK